MEDWRKNELGFNSWLFKNKERLGISNVGQIESWIKLNSGEYHFFEIKTQEPFKPPPFIGHGLPRWQIDKYLQMQMDCGVIWNIVVCDMETQIGYKQRLSVLEDGKYYDTHGKSPRRIYPIESFDKFTDNWKITLVTEGQ